MRDVRRRDAAHEPQRQRDLRLARERRMAAGEDEPQPVVGDRVGRSARAVVGLGLEQQRQLRLERAPRAQRVEREAARDRRQPRARAARARRRAPRSRSACDVRVLHRLLGGVEVARDAHRRGEHEGPLAPVRVGDGLLDGAQLASTTSKPSSGRTSTPPSTIGVIRGERERVVEIARLEDEDAAEHLLRLDERAVGDHARRGSTSRSPAAPARARRRPGRPARRSGRAGCHVALHHLRRAAPPAAPARRSAPRTAPSRHRLGRRTRRRPSRSTPARSPPGRRRRRTGGGRRRRASPKRRARRGGSSASALRTPRNGPVA